jgi:hypothetical protein
MRRSAHAGFVVSSVVVSMRLAACACGPDRKSVV